MAVHELEADVKRAVAEARRALEHDAAEARNRGWGSPSPDSAPVASLAAGILVANVISAAGEAERTDVPSGAGARRVGASGSEEGAGAGKTKAPARAGKRRRGRMLPLRERKSTSAAERTP